MNISLAFIRAFFLLVSTFIATASIATSLDGGFTPLNILISIAFGILFSFAIVAADLFFKKFNLRSFNIALIGLFIGYLMGNAILLIAKSVFQLSPSLFNETTKNLIEIAVFLFTGYLGMCMAARASEEFYTSIPFVKFKPVNYKKKDFLIDISLLQDSRILDLAASGLLDHQLVLPRFVIRELQHLSENSNETSASKARRSLEIYKKLENMAHLEMRYAETDFHDMHDSTAKLTRLARLLDANIITSDIGRILPSAADGISIININTLANALKPLSQTGEYINIKIQHPGKGARQGVGYLDDGTMVVINGGADNLGEIIKAQVVSVKHTTSGRMIFCNSTDEGLLSEQESAESLANLNLAPKPYFAL